ncbi:VanZ family protein [Paenibacillus glycanilyticus]|uniref:VanZ family protein n=1 Tax=Paenibacillus glycanilyticus TaxID=126569 RepID=A0ABQ6GDR6_9BACL|nr:VanZ family protein [Paenibacillus glycanilyticus]GLX67383.1 VanZ family protein [Paenibacillus glycanilyticus]
MMKKTRKNSIIWFFVVFCWIFFIFTLSSESYNQQSIKPTLNKWVTKEELAEKLPNTSVTYRGDTVVAKEDPYGFVEFFFRKGAHLFMYAVLAATLYMFIRNLMGRRQMVLPVIMALILTGGTAAMDERNQLSSVGRTGNPTDVIVDLTGACIGLIVCILVSQWIGRRRNRSEYRFARRL